MITCAKALSSGYLPIGAVMVSEAIYAALVKESEKIGVFSHGFTYSGHPVSSAVALETLKIYEQDDILSHVRRVAPRMQAGLRQVRGSSPGGRGSGHRADRRSGVGSRQSFENAVRRPPKPSVRFWSSALITTASSSARWAIPSRSVLRSSSTKRRST